MANLAYQVTGFAYQGVGQFAYQGSVDAPAPVEIERGGGGDRKRRYLKKPKVKTIRWADFAHREERAEALAQALAESAIPIKVVTDDPFVEEDEAIIHALLLSRILH